MNYFHAHSKKVETKFRQRLVTDGRVSAQDASAATWVIGRAAAEQRWQSRQCKTRCTCYQQSKGAEQRCSGIRVQCMSRAVQLDNGQSSSPAGSSLAVASLLAMPVG